MDLPEFFSPAFKDKRRVEFICTDGALKELITILKIFEIMGNLGSSREVIIKDYGEYFFDGDGNHKLSHIRVDGLSIDEWIEEEKRIKELRAKRNIRRVFKLTDPEDQNETLS